MFLLREVRPADLDDLEHLAGRLNTLNLPANTAKLKKLIERSRASFGGRFDDPLECEYIFVLRDLIRDKAIGTCMVIAQHGTKQRPAVYFNVRTEQKYSHTFDLFHEHRVLELRFDFNGPTEIGGLVLDPDYRGHRLQLGKLLSYLRFLYIGMRPEKFRDEIVAELLPELNADGTSDLWDALGAKFTGLDYMTADKNSRENIEFVRNLFPNAPLYVTLLPKQIQEKIGVVGRQSAPAAALLSSIGFKYDNSIDPFDGGPTYRCRVQDCELTRRVEWVRFAGKFDGTDPDGVAMVGFEYEAKLVRFRASVGAYRRTPEGVLFVSERVDMLRIKEGDMFAFMPLSGPGLRSLYDLNRVEDEH
jgi:arginine N-succinyltransferase